MMCLKMFVDELGIVTHAHEGFDPDEDDGLPWEIGVLRCFECGHEAQVITHFPTIRKNLECPKCGALEME